MPQYPMPPWRIQDLHLHLQRRTRLGVQNPRYADLPLVTGRADGSIEVLRGESALAETIRGKGNTSILFEDGQVGEPHYVTVNRLGHVHVTPTVRPVVRGMLEFDLYSAPYTPPVESMRAARSFDALRAVLRAEIDRLDALEADGWEFYTELREEPPVELAGEEVLPGRTVALNQRLIDTRRPDEVLTARDLPDVSGE